MDLVSKLWSSQIHIFPVLLGLLFYEFPAFLRRLKKIYYVPIYFSVFPFRAINQQLSYYLADDLMGIGGHLDEAAAERLRRRLIVTSIVSAFLDAILIPLVFGVVVALFYSRELLREFIVSFAIYKVIVIVISIWRFHFFSITSTNKTGLLAVVYFSYIYVAIQMILTGYGWAFPFVSSNNWSGMLQSFNHVVVRSLFIQGILFVVFVTILTNWLADRELRIKKRTKHGEHSDLEEPYDQPRQTRPQRKH